MLAVKLYESNTIEQAASNPQGLQRLRFPPGTPGLKWSALILTQSV
jgi:hypothetical protein